MAKKRRLRKSGYFRSKETSTEEQTKTSEPKKEATPVKKKSFSIFSPKTTKTDSTEG